MKPIRFVRRTDRVQDPWDGAPLQMEQRTDAHVLTDDGAIRSCHDTHRRACVCGCVRPVGGVCADCGGPVCVGCFGFCDRCRKPVCPRHCVHTPLPSPQGSRLCRECADSRARSAIIRRVIRGVLSPFLRFNDHERP